MRFKTKLLTIALAVCLMVSLVGTVCAAPSNLSDIQGHWAKPQIEKWVDNGIIKGYQDGTFKPEQAVTRAEFVTLLIKGFDIQNPAAVADFTDVKATDWFYKEVAAATTAKYVSGYGDGRFGPNDPMTREMVARLVANYLQLAEDQSEVTFKDAAAISPWAKGYVKALVANKVVSGYEDNTFRPAKAITRAEAVVILEKAMAVQAVEEELQGTVLMDGQAVAGATVNLFAKDGYTVLEETTTNIDGQFTFAVAAGEYDLTATKGENLGFVSDVAVVAGQPAQSEITLVKGVKVTGKLTDKNNRSLNNVDVVFTTNPTFITRTDGSGNYTIYLLPDRKYSVRSFIPGKVSEGIKVIANEVVIGNTEKGLGTLKASFAIISSGGGGGGGGGGVSGPVAATLINVSTSKVEKPLEGKYAVRVYLLSGTTDDYTIEATSPSGITFKALTDKSGWYSDPDSIATSFTFKVTRNSDKAYDSRTLTYGVNIPVEATLVNATTSKVVSPLQGKYAARVYLLSGTTDAYTIEATSPSGITFKALADKSGWYSDPDSSATSFTFTVTRNSDSAYDTRTLTYTSSGGNDPGGNDPVESALIDTAASKIETVTVMPGVAFNMCTIMLKSGTTDDYTITASSPAGITFSARVDKGGWGANLGENTSVTVKVERTSDQAFDNFTI